MHRQNFEANYRRGTNRLVNPSDRAQEGMSQHHTDDEENARTIHVRGLTPNITKEDLKNYFSRHGRVTEVVILKDHKRESRGFGFVIFEHVSMVEGAIANRSPIINGKQVEVDRRRLKGELTNKRIFVGKIPAEMTEDGLKNLFSKYGVVRQCNIVREKSTNISRGFGFVTFETEQQATDLLGLAKVKLPGGAMVHIEKHDPLKARPPPPIHSRPHDASRSEFGYGYGGGGSGGAGANAYGGHGEMGGGARGTYYREEPSLGYPGRSGGFSGGLDQAGRSYMGHVSGGGRGTYRGWRTGFSRRSIQGGRFGANGDPIVGRDPSRGTGPYERGPSRASHFGAPEGRGTGGGAGTYLGWPSLEYLRYSDQEISFSSFASIPW